MLPQQLICMQHKLIAEATGLDSCHIADAISRGLDEWGCSHAGWARHHRRALQGHEDMG